VLIWCYIFGFVFIRRIKSPNGRTYIQIVEKVSGSYKVRKSFGGAVLEDDLKELEVKAKNWMNSYRGVEELDFSKSDQAVDILVSSISAIRRVGYDLLLGKIFDEIGFNQVGDEVFRELVLARVAFPKSKLKTTEYLLRYKQIDWGEDQIYRYLDKLYSNQKELVQQISYKHTLQVLKGLISVVFYDVTTLYFEVDDEDELRKTGFSKEGKHQSPQIVLGLLVSRGGYPLAYEIYAGNKFEGHTMLPVLEAFRQKYQFEKLAVIADSGLMSNDNLTELQHRGYEFIIGARIKNEQRGVRNEILSLSLKNGESAIVRKGDLRLVITYSDDRAKKDRYNREKGIRKLEKQLRKGRLTKASINNRGYNKFLTLKGEVAVSIDQNKVESDKKWDGLKGYVTNARLSKEEIIENYQQLWQIEKAFRIAKTDLRIRPIYHRLQRRIEAHICISFTAYKIYKELERQLKARKSRLSPARALEIAENILELTIKMPQNGMERQQIFFLTEEQKELQRIFGLGC